MKFSRQLAISFFAGSLYLLAACGESPQSQAQGGPPPAPPVSVAKVIQHKITEWDEFTGRLEATESVSLRPRISGYIDSVTFTEGTLIKEGEVLFTIDSDAFDAEVNRLSAELADEQSQLQLAKSSYKRALGLNNTNAISKEDLDSRSAELDQAKARVRSVAAALDAAKLNLSYTKVTAPIAGRVSRAVQTKGNYVSAGSSLLTTIVSVDRMYAYFDTDEQTYLKYLQLEQQGTLPSTRYGKNPVYLGLANESDHPHEGYVDFIDNQIDTSTGTIRGRAVFENDNGQFVPGMFARLKLIGSAPYDAILISDKAIATDLKTKFVLVVDDQNTAQYRSIILGEKINGLRIVKSGLTAEDRIVVNGLQRVRPGSPVAPSEVPMADDETLQALQSQQSRVDHAVKETSLADGKTNADAGIGG